MHAIAGIPGYYCVQLIKPTESHFLYAGRSYLWYLDILVRIWEIRYNVQKSNWKFLLYAAEKTGQNLATSRHIFKDWI
jgi:hypothetical protein